jgi:hypothetical protein
MRPWFRRAARAALLTARLAAGVGASAFAPYGTSQAAPLKDDQAWSAGLLPASLCGSAAAVLADPAAGRERPTHTTAPGPLTDMRRPAGRPGHVGRTPSHVGRTPSHVGRTPRSRRARSTTVTRPHRAAARAPVLAAARTAARAPARAAARTAARAALQAPAATRGHHQHARRPEQPARWPEQPARWAQQPGPPGTAGQHNQLSAPATSGGLPTTGADIAGLLALAAGTIAFGAGALFVTGRMPGLARRRLVRR